jgi:succinyl-CoA synthetase beta subunit
MRLYEYEGKEIFKKCGIAVPQGILVKTPREARQAAIQIDKEVVLKPQILAGGRGKAGGIKTAKTPQDAERMSEEMLEMELEGYKVNSLLVEERLEVAKEMYLGITVDDKNGVPIAMASAEGGVAIEEVAKRSPEKIASSLINPLYGLRGYEAINLMCQIGLSGETLISASRILPRLYNVFASYDARIAEINPLVMTNEGEMIACDSRCEIDDHSLFRHPELQDLRIQRIENVWEREGVKAGVNYVDLEGDIAVMANGAGLTMSVLDMIKDEGGRPACFLDTGGGLSKERMKNSVSILLKKAKSDPGIKVILLMARMMISPPDAVAEGIIEAIKEVKVETPIIAIMRGREPYQKRAQELLKDSEVKLYSNVEEGIREAIRIAR